MNQTHVLHKPDNSDINSTLHLVLAFLPIHIWFYYCAINNHLSGSKKMSTIFNGEKCLHGVGM